MSSIVATQNDTFNQNDIHEDEVEIKSGDYWLQRNSKNDIGCKKWSKDNEKTTTAWYYTGYFV